nr:MAG TPA: hypothetical protein [Caudoviricetes sp.]
MLRERRSESCTAFIVLAANKAVFIFVQKRKEVMENQQVKRKTAEVRRRVHR